MGMEGGRVGGTARGNQLDRDGLGRLAHDAGCRWSAAGARRARRGGGGRTFAWTEGAFWLAKSAGPDNRARGRVVYIDADKIGCRDFLVSSPPRSRRRRKQRGCSARSRARRRRHSAACGYPGRRVCWRRVPVDAITSQILVAIPEVLASVGSAPPFMTLKVVPAAAAVRLPPPSGVLRIARTNSARLVCSAHAAAAGRRKNRRHRRRSPVERRPRRRATARQHAARLLLCLRLAATRDIHDLLPALRAFRAPIDGSLPDFLRRCILDDVGLCHRQGARRGSTPSARPPW